MAATTYLAKVDSSASSAGSLLSLFKNRVKAVMCGNAQVGIAYNFELKSLTYDTVTFLSCLADIDETLFVLTSSAGIVTPAIGQTITVDGYALTLESIP